MMRLRRKKKGKLFWQGFFAEEGNIYWLILNSYDQYMPVILMNSSRRTYKIMNLKGIVCEFSISLQVLMKSCVVFFFILTSGGLFVMYFCHSGHLSPAGIA